MELCKIQQHKMSQNLKVTITTITTIITTTTNIDKMMMMVMVTVNEMILVYCWS